MPIVLDYTDEGMEHLDDVQLFDEDGEMTLEAEVLFGFLTSLDFDDVMEDEDVKEFIETETGWYTEDEDGNLVPAKEGDKDAALWTIESLDGEIAAMFVDEDDLYEMFRYYVANMPEETLEEKTLKAVFADVLDEEDDENVDEAKGPFKRGAFKKIHKKAGGPALVNRMLGAMMAKQAIKKAGSQGTKYLAKGVTAKGGTKPGTGQGGSDYEKASGYAPGTGSGVKKWRAYKGKMAADLTKQEKKTLKAKSGKAKLKAAPKKGLKKAGAKSLAKKKAAGKKSMGASDTTTPPANTVESQSRPAYHRASSVGLAGSILESMGHGKKTEQK